MNKPKSSIVVLVGLPGSGKSTYVEKLLQIDKPLGDIFSARNYVVISSDNVIEEYAKSVGKTYNEVFRHAYKECEKIMKENFRNAIATERNIIYDQTNMTAKKRASILSQIPKEYYKIVVHCTAGLDIVKERLAEREARTGKHIPWNVVEDMLKQLDPPSLGEGFDEMLMI